MSKATDAQHKILKRIQRGDDYIGRRSLWNDEVSDFEYYQINGSDVNCRTGEAIMEKGFVYPVDEEMVKTRLKPGMVDGLYTLYKLSEEGERATDEYEARR